MLSLKQLFRCCWTSLPAAVSILILTNQGIAQVPIIQPGPPGQPARIITAEEAANLASIQYSAGDVMFLQGMISHHAQAMDCLLYTSPSPRDATLSRLTSYA